MTGRATDPIRVRVDTAPPYDVVIGAGVLAEVRRLLDLAVRQVAVVHPPSCSQLAESVRRQLEAAGKTCLMVGVPDGEAAKTLPVAADLWSLLGRHGFTRSDAVVGVGGGSTTDVAGFVAATWLRGVQVIHVPTTVLGMVDAAIGGKTAINTAEGKNLVGAFSQPAGVLCDLDTLRTLPAAEVRSGLAEVVKCGFVADPAILDLLERDPAASLDVSSDALCELVERSVRVKAAVVAADPAEDNAGSGVCRVGREALNYGHTLGHAIEREEGFRIRHGEAVALGMVFAAALARRAGRLDAATAQRHVRVLDSVGLPTSYSQAEWASLQAAMRVDKKSRGDRLRLVVLERLARPVILESPAPDLLAAAYADLGRSTP